MPLYLQLKSQLLHALTSGSVAAGDQLPTVRELAVHLAINPNTVNRAYAELERDGVLATRRGRGTFVASSAGPADFAAQAARLHAIVKRALAEAGAFGFGPAELVEAIELLGRGE